MEERTRMRAARRKRPTKEQYYLSIAEDVARRSTCFRRNYGAVIVRDDQIVATGYGGAPRGMVHCTTDIGFCSRARLGAKKGEHYEYCRAVHAEQNAIVQARRTDMLNGTLYLAGLDARSGEIQEDAEPCGICKRLIINAGIKDVIVLRNKGPEKFVVAEWARNNLGELRQEGGRFVPVHPFFRQSSRLDDEREKKLRERFPLGQAAVVQTNSFDDPRHTVGRAAASYFTREVTSGKSVALSCGDTVLSMLESLPPLAHLTLTIHQLSVEGDPKMIHQAPATLVGLLRAKCSAESPVFGFQLPPLALTGSSERLREEIANGEFLAKLRAEVRRSDFVFIGLGSAGPGSPSFWAMAQAATHGEFPDVVKKLGIVGEINNQVFDASGNDCTGRIPGLSKHVVNVLSLEEIRSMASNFPKQKVVMLATGREKTEAMRVALQSGFANVFITGSGDADRLLTPTEGESSP
jgi:dCMP deaminase